MNDLKVSIAILMAYITVVLGVANIDSFQESVINFRPEFFLLVALIVFSELVVTGYLIKEGVRITYYMVISFWVAVYALLWIFYFANDRPLQVEIIQMLLVGLSAGLAYDLGKRIGQLDRTINELTSNIYPNRVLDVKIARERIDNEISRSRRYHYPLAILVVGIDLWGAKSSKEHLHFEALEQDVVKRLAVAKVGQILSDYSRITDMILKDGDNLFLLLCPETDSNNMAILANRINNVVTERLKVGIHWGSASFPDEAITFEDLVVQAKSRYSLYKDVDS